MGLPIDDYVTGGEGSNAPAVPAGAGHAEIVVRQRDAALKRISELEGHVKYADELKEQLARDRYQSLHRIADLEATVTAQAQEIGRLRGTDPGIEIAPGVRLVWQRGDVGVLAFEPGAIVPEESHKRDEVGVVIAGYIRISPLHDKSISSTSITPSWRVLAGTAHTMTAGPEGAVVGVRWSDERPGLTGEEFIAAVEQAAPAGYQDDAELEARLARMRATEQAANPLISYMPIDGLSMEAMIDGLRGMALGALRSLKDSGRRAIGVKLIVTEEP